MEKVSSHKARALLSRSTNDLIIQTVLWRQCQPFWVLLPPSWSTWESTRTREGILQIWHPPFLKWSKQITSWLSFPCFPSKFASDPNTTPETHSQPRIKLVNGEEAAGWSLEVKCCPRMQVSHDSYHDTPGQLPTALMLSLPGFCTLFTRHR